MKKILAATSLALMLSTPGWSQINIFLGVPPPPIRVEAPPPPPPAPEFFWVNGFWAPEGPRYRWIAGHYERPPYPGAFWYGPHYEQGPQGWGYHRGYWGQPEHGRGHAYGHYKHDDEDRDDDRGHGHGHGHGHDRD